MLFPENFLIRCCNCKDTDDLLRLIASADQRFDTYHYDFGGRCARGDIAPIIGSTIKQPRRTRFSCCRGRPIYFPTIGSDYQVAGFHTRRSTECLWTDQEGSCPGGSEVYQASLQGKNCQDCCQQASGSEVEVWEGSAGGIQG